jgi:hypothetical protein
MQEQGNKIVVEYQPTDENGIAIGEPTRLVADSWEEMSKKQSDAHIAATRALHRQNKAFEILKTRKPTPVAPKPEPKQLTADEEYQAGLELQNPKTAKQGLETLVPIADTTKRVEQIELELEIQKRDRAARTWMSSHTADYFPCQANEAMLRDYLDQQGLAWTVGNLDIAFVALSAQLAQRPKANNAPPAVAAPEVTNDGNNAPTNAAPPARQATGTIQPGQFTARSPVRQTGMTKKEALLLSRNNPNEFKRMMRNPELKKVLEAALNS